MDPTRVYFKQSNISRSVTQVFLEEVGWSEIGIKNKECFFVKSKEALKQTSDKSGYNF